MIKKIIVRGDKAREKLLRGVNVIGEIVGSTIGPAGRNVIIYEKYRSPLITNDGVTIARKTYLEDEIEDLGAQTLVEAAMKTNDQAGDGTTTAVVLATALTNKCFNELKESDASSMERRDAMTMFRQINESKARVVELLRERAKPLQDGDLENIISTSLENPEFGKILAGMIKEVGKDGYISVEDNWATQYGIATEVISGMKFYGEYATPYMMTDARRKEAVAEDVPVLVTNGQLEEISSLDKLFQAIQKEGKTRLVIITETYSRQLVEKLAETAIGFHQGKKMQILCVKAPALVPDEYEDIATYVNATFLDRKAGFKLKDAELSHLGHAEKVVVTDSDVIITGGAGKVDERIAELQGQMEGEKDLMFKEKLKRRIAALSSGVGIIRVGAMTETERGYLKFKIEDAVNAGRAALEEGTVRGGGLALKEIAEELGRNNILYEALLAPYEKIQENAGNNLVIGEHILDPVKVTRLAVENACSAAGTLITTEAAISERRKSLWDELEKRISVNDEEDDFRDDSNQDLGKGRLV